MNAKVVVKIPHCIWREGRPRFVPAKGLRELGFKGQDLKHPDGRWFSLKETEDWCTELIAEIAAIRKEASAGQPKRRRKPPETFSISHVIKQGLEIAGRRIEDGKKRRKPLSPKTLDWYRKLAKVLQEDHPSVWAAAPAHLTVPVLARVLDAIEVKRGLATARGVRAMLSATWNRVAMLRSMPPNPCGKISMPTMPPRLRYGTIEEMKHLIATADAMGLPEIGDSIMLGLMTAQRQNDRLTLTGGQIENGRVTLRQSKTGMFISVPAAPQLVARLQAAQERRRDWRVNYPHVILYEATRAPFDINTYRHKFAQVRNKAAETMASLEDFHDQDLRDTAVTWLALAGCEIPEIFTITGHSLDGTYAIMKHYLGQHPDMANSAIGKLVIWLEGQGADL